MPTISESNVSVYFLSMAYWGRKRNGADRWLRLPCRGHGFLKRQEEGQNVGSLPKESKTDTSQMSPWCLNEGRSPQNYRLVNSWGVLFSLQKRPVGKVLNSTILSHTKPSQPMGFVLELAEVWRNRIPTQPYHQFWQQMAVGHMKLVVPVLLTPTHRNL